MHILVIEDEPTVSAFIKEGLEQNGHTVDVAFDGNIGLRKAKSGSFELVLLDLNIPIVNGIELCRQIKEEKPGLPVLMLTALGTTEDKVKGFDAGADDYLVKPFEFAELIARIRALTKRYFGIAETTNTIRVADLELDLQKKLAIRNGNKIELTAKEFALLEYFMRNKGKVLSRSEISEAVWDIDFDTETNVVDVYVNILRKKIDKQYAYKLIHTRIGMGYIFESE
ncbi:MAG: response regulator transcription factor [Chitinophagales bacterium]